MEEAAQSERTQWLTSPATLVTAGVMGAVLVWLLKPDPPPIAGVYRQRGRWYWLKRAVFFVLFHLRARQSKKKKKLQRDWNSGPTGSQQAPRGLGSSMQPCDMERCQPLQQQPRAIDCVYIGAYSRGEEGPSLSLRVGRRHHRQAEVWLVMHVPGVGHLQHPVHPDTLITNTDPHSWSAGGLRFDVVHPMKTWKVRFSGPLRLDPCGTEVGPTRYVDTSFSFQWDAFAPHFNYDADLNASMLGDAIARETWSKDYFDSLQRLHQTHYEQWGQLRGTLSIEGHPPQQLCLRAIRDHSFGVRQWTDFYRYIACFLCIENGTTLQVSAVSIPGQMSHFQVGCVTYPTGEVETMSSISLNLWEVGEEEQRPPPHWGLTFMAGGVHCELSVRTKCDSVLYHESDRGGVVHEAFCDVTLNGRQGCGLSEFFYRNTTRSEVKAEPSLPLLTEPDWDDVAENRDQLCLPFTSPSCCSSALVGGKGSQLALLTKLSQRESVSVPPGLCLTLRAFEQQLEANSELEQALKLVASTAVTKAESLGETCRTASEDLGKTSVCSSVRSSLIEGLETLFGDQWTTKRLAVRSSAAGEDGTDASSAGQMETFLGIMGEEEMLRAVQKCWASAYTYQAVEYRRQHGQPVLTSVAVVIQLMVPAETAGVLFTADPVTNNSSLLSINANFGLGESVVSGKCEPDTITVHRAWDGTLTIAQRQAGHKRSKVTMQDEGGITEVPLSAGDCDRYCLSDDIILALATMGILIEKYFGSPRDIEWAYASGTIHLLQARPITTADQETEEELMHEFDSPLAGGYEVLTTGNIGEMMPGAVTPLTLSTFVQAIASSMQRLGRGFGARQQVVDFPKAITACGNNLFISITDTYQVLVKVALTRKEVVEVNLLGETRADLDMAVTMDYMDRPPPSALTRACNALRMLRYLKKGSGMTAGWEKRVQAYSLGEGCTTAVQLYTDIDQHLPDFMEVWHWTLTNSANSGSWSSVLLGIIRGSSECTVQHFGDIALLLSQCHDVHSAEVPSAMQDLAKQITQEGLKERFCASSDEECIGLLQSDRYPVLAEKTQAFLNRHGHRCIREAEMFEKSWHLDSSKLIGVLKTILESGSFEKEAKKVKTAEQLVSELQTPLSFSTRKVLQFLLPKAWAAVASREWGKSIAVKMNDIFKTAYWKLAALMVEEGRLPNKDLLFFLTHYEIGVLLHTRSARLVMKAQRRRKLLPKQMKLRFPKISIGHPKPIERTKESFASGSSAASVLKGMPVSQGVVSGTARVVLSLADAHSIQAGDVLVVSSTDVGWSPYFPLIAGLVTEMGGLISHGAVVAREYGIPCVVNIADATLAIHSGAVVELDGRAGTVTVLAQSST